MNIILSPVILNLFLQMLVKNSKCTDLMNLLTYASKEKDLLSDNEAIVLANTFEECSCKSSRRDTMK